MSDKPGSGSSETGGQKAPSSIAVPKLKRRGLKGFITDVRAELKKVTWPTTRETNRLTGVVLTVCFMCVAVLWALSTAFGFALDAFFRSAR